MADRTGPKLIEAHPTKGLFISMLVKDIGLVRSIVDLVDNSVDGAKRLRGDGRYDGLSVRIEAREDQFRIADNCGGIEVDVARDHAFRFGRPPEARPVRHSVGQFGVGMKRALFKMGEWFNIESTAANSRFTLEVDVEQWSQTEEWNFEFSDLKENIPEIDLDERGTTITIKRLHDSVAKSFALENFQNRLREELEQAHIESMDGGLSISLNGIPLRSDPLLLLHSDELRPAMMEDTYRSNGDPVKVKVYAGIADSDPPSAGWYVFCNGRLVLGRDQSSVTGWGDMLPRYHNQYAHFRGYVFFDSDDASNLPWNTTKTGVDSDSPIYQAVRLEMMKLALPVFKFLNRLKVERDRDNENGKPLEAAIKAAWPENLSSVETEDGFVAPQPQRRPPQPDTASIQYRRTIKEIDRVKELLQVSSNREVGERTFEYFLEMESDD